MSSPGSIPVIRLTLESMQHAILMAFTDHAVSMDLQVREAVQQFATPENLQRILAKQVADSIESAIAEEVRKFYAYGSGRHVVEKAVRDHLEASAKRHAELEGGAS